MIKLVYRLYERKADQPWIGGLLSAWKATSSQGRWLAILKQCENLVKRFPSLRLKLILTVEFELPTTLEEQQLDAYLPAFPSSGLERTYKISKNPLEAALSLTEDIN